MFTLVPSNFFNPDKAYEALAGVAELKEGSVVKHIEIPYYNAVLVYSVDEDSLVNTPEIIEILLKLPDCKEYNKILCSYRNGLLYLAIAQGKSLLLANSFVAPDFVTAQYYIFLAVKSLQINPEVSTISFLNTLAEEEEMSLYRYFKSVVIL